MMPSLKQPWRPRYSTTSLTLLALQGAGLSNRLLFLEHVSRLVIPEPNGTVVSTTDEHAILINRQRVDNGLQHTQGSNWLSGDIEIDVGKCDKLPRNHDQHRSQRHLLLLQGVVQKFSKGQLELFDVVSSTGRKRVFRGVRGQRANGLRVWV